MQSNRTKKNFYQVLGLNPHATTMEIDEAYRKLSKEWHPDKHKKDRKLAQTKFHDICEAYDILSNSNRRSHYDEMLKVQFSDHDAEKTFQKFYQDHGFANQQQERFFNEHYPNRKKNYYDVLGVSRNCSYDDVKNAYRKLALQYHPKNNRNSAQSRKRFNQINQAFNRLSSESKKHNYDIIQFGQMAPIRARNIFDSFWEDRFHELEEADQLFKPMLRTRWTKNMDRMLREIDSKQPHDSNIKDGQSYRTQEVYTNKNGVQCKKSITSRTKYVDGVATTEKTEQYQYPDGKKEVRKITDDGKGNVESKVYHLNKGEQLRIQG